MSRPLYVQAGVLDGSGVFVWMTNTRISDHEDVIGAIDAVSAQLKDCTPAKYLVDYDLEDDLEDAE